MRLHPRRSWWIVGGLVLAMALPAVVVPAASASSFMGQVSTSRQFPTVPLGAGYILVNNRSGSVTDSVDTFEVPTATCVTSPNGTANALVEHPLASQAAQIGAGLYDGPTDFSQFTAYQLGIEPLCPDYLQNPVYEGLYMALVLSPVTASDPSGFDTHWISAPNLVMHPGDSIRSIVAWTPKTTGSPSTITFDLRDLTSNDVFMKTIAASSFAPDGAFCLIQQYNNMVRFSPTTQDCRATVNGRSGGIATFPAPNLVFRSVELGLGTAVSVAPGNLEPDGATYTDTWITSKPYEIEHPELLHQRTAPGLAGYLLLNHQRGSVSGVSDSYVQPSAICNTREKQGEPTSPLYPGDQELLVGSGLYTGNTELSNYSFYQVGTAAYCQEFIQDPVYFPFYLESVVTPLSPHGAFTMVRLPGLAVHPGDSIRSSVVVLPRHELRFDLTDLSDGVTVSATIIAPSAAPNGAACVSRALVNLAEFRTMTQSCRATVDAVTRGVGDFAAPNQLDGFNLVNTAGVTQATTSALACDGMTFSVRWDTSAPLWYEP